MQTRPHLVEIQHLRAFAVLLVIWAHLYQSEVRFFSDPGFGSFALTGFIGVDVFFVVSGYIIHHLYGQQAGLNIRFFLNRLNRIFPLYWVFTLAALAGYFIMGDSLTENASDLNLASSLTLIPTGQAPILLVGWTLTHELYFYLAYGLFMIVPKPSRIWVVGLWAVLTIGFSLAPNEHASPWLVLILSPFNMLFLAGAVLSEFQSDLQNRKWAALVLTLIGAILALGWTGIHGLDGLTEPRLRVAVYSGFAIGVVWAFLAWRPALPALFTKFGDWSYALYLSHILVIGVLARVMSQFIDSHLWASPVYYCLVLTACLLVGWISHILLERPLLKMGKTLIGRVRSKA